MRWIWRALTVAFVFAAVGYATARLLIAHAVARGAPEYSIRLGGAMGGLFVGGVAAVLVALVMLLGGKRSSGSNEPDQD